VQQIQMGLREQRIPDRMVSIFDPTPGRSARAARQAQQVGYVTQICEATENANRGAAG
jgi:hypothetical protein